MTDHLLAGVRTQANRYTTEATMREGIQLSKMKREEENKKKKEERRY